MPNAVLSYVNFAFRQEAVVADIVGDWEASAPPSNVLTPQLGMAAIASGTLGHAFNVFISGDSPTQTAEVGLVGILGTNIVGVDDATDVSIDMYDDDNNVYTAYLSDAFFQAAEVGDGVFQSHIFWVVANDLPDAVGKRIVYIRFGVGANAVTGTKDPYTGVITRQPLKIGGVWFGPAFTPTNGISIERFGQSVEDNSRVLRSIGGQVWTSPEVRQRASSIEFPGLYEDEVYASAPAQSLQQLAMYCGISRPLVVIPIANNDELTFLQGIYGYMPSTPKWHSVNKVIDPDAPQSKVRLYTGSLEIIEAR